MSKFSMQIAGIESFLQVIAGSLGPRSLYLEHRISDKQLDQGNGVVEVA